MADINYRNSVMPPTERCISCMYSYNPAEYNKCERCAFKVCQSCSHVHLTPIGNEEVLLGARFCRGCFMGMFPAMNNDAVIWPMVNVRRWLFRTITRDELVDAERRYLEHVEMKKLENRMSNLNVKRADTPYYIDVDLDLDASDIDVDLDASSDGQMYCDSP